MSLKYFHNIVISDTDCRKIAFQIYKLYYVCFRKMLWYTQYKEICYLYELLSVLTNYLFERITHHINCNYRAGK